MAIATALPGLLAAMWPHMSDTPIFPRHTGFFWARKARFVNINKRHIRQGRCSSARFYNEATRKR
eukprot:scaffold113707_cov51-Phaeocystis_antarctica.AAC.1